MVLKTASPPSWPRINWKDLVKLLPDRWFAIVAQNSDEPEEIFIEKLSPAMLREMKYKDWKGKKCYEFINNFTKPCFECPILLSWRDGQGHAREQVFRNPARYNTEQVMILHTMVAAIPLGRGKDGVNRYLEFFLGRTRQEKTSYEKRIRKHEFDVALSSLIDRAGDDVANELILFGAISKLGLGFQEANLFVIVREDQQVLPAMVKKKLTLIVKENNDLDLQLIEDEILNSASQVDLENLRALLLVLIERDEYSSSIPLTELLLEHEAMDLQRMEGRLNLPFAFRLHPQWAISPILGGNRELHSVLLCKCYPNTLISNDNLLDFTIFSLFLHHAMTNRDTTRAFTTAVKKADKLSRRLGGKASDVVYAGTVITGLGHDLLNSQRHLRELARMLIYEIPQHKSESIEFQPIITEFWKSLEFQRKCLERTVQTARATTPRFQKLDLAETVNEVIVSFKYTLVDSGVHLHIRNNLVPGMLVDHDVFLIRQVFYNLIDNSIYWLKRLRKKDIVIELSSRDTNSVQINYKDTGPGISSNIANIIWEPFFTMGGGSGLGLTTVKRIIEAHKGAISLYSDYHDYKWGACFRIIIPVKQDAKGG
ncbi:ATP-binding protein [Chloroflexota bacterium]